MQKINFGCGLSVVNDWKNYDASPTLRLQRLPVVGWVAQFLIQPYFPREAIYGDVVRGLPLGPASVDRVYCSHVLEHLALVDFRKALSEVLRILKPGGIFRGVLPDLEHEIRVYLANPAKDACSTLMIETYLGVMTRPQGLSGLARTLFGNSHHLWMWDYRGICTELENAGFVEIRRAEFCDSDFDEFNAVEDPNRWRNSLGFECKKAG